MQFLRALVVPAAERRVGIEARLPPTCVRSFRLTVSPSLASTEPTLR
jgi:hypothetical protein